MRRHGHGWHSRDVELVSHGATHHGRTNVVVTMAGEHARLEFSGYWRSASIALEHSELELIRDAINAALAEGPPR